MQEKQRIQMKNTVPGKEIRAQPPEEQKGVHKHAVSMQKLRRQCNLQPGKRGYVLPPLRWD